jgi:serine/threonine protein kinase
MTGDHPAVSAPLAGRYRIERELGRGGMATVYLARDLKHDRPVALKVLRPEIAATVGADRFLREIAITAQLDHPHVLTLIDSGEAGGSLFYVVPYVRGESLRARLTREKQLPLDEALRITQQVANALDYAHRHGVIHRDVKPENILLHEGEAMVVDFGIALAVNQGSGSRLTATGLSIGTPEYMSPEQAGGDRQLDARSDVYSLGAVLYEMLAGEPPHTGPTARAVVAKIFSEPPTPLHVVRGGIPAGMETALARALAKDPADRFASAAEFASALSVKGGRVAARLGWSPSRRALFALLLVGAASAALWAWHPWRTAHRPLVIMMDSPHPSRIYDEETIRTSGTNADVISDIMADLPIVRQKETGGPGWHRYDELVAFRPDLIVMHYSTFRGPDTDDPRPPLKVFLRYFADQPTRFLIYTRTPEAEVRRVLDSLMADVEAEHSGMLARITVFGTPDHGGSPRWRDPVTAGELKLAVKRILKLN